MKGKGELNKRGFGPAYFGKKIKMKINVVLENYKEVDKGFLTKTCFIDAVVTTTTTSLFRKSSSTTHTITLYKDSIFWKKLNDGDYLGISVEDREIEKKLQEKFLNPYGFNSHRKAQALWEKECK